MDGLLFNRRRLRRRPVAGIIFASEEPRKSVDQLDHSRIKRGRFAFFGCAGVAGHDHSTSVPGSEIDRRVMIYYFLKLALSNIGRYSH
jgi:uncharacterized protein YlaI